MEFLVAGYEIIEQEPGLIGMYKAAELPGRTCYGSQDRITETSAEPFCKGLMKTNHGAPLEHGTVYLKCELGDEELFFNEETGRMAVVSHKGELDHYITNNYSKVNCDEKYMYVTTNLRVLFENNWLDDLKYWCEPTEYHEKRIQVRFTVDRFTGEEFLRHRKGSFNRESTRYVLFTREKFGGGSIKYIIPVWMLDQKLKIDHYAENDVTWYANSVLEHERTGQPLSELFYWMCSLKFAEWSYSNLVNKCGWTAQMARTVLPCAISSPLIMTAFVDDWKHFFNLRAKGTTGKPHPQAFELAEPLMKEFAERNYIEKEFIKE